MHTHTNFYVYVVGPYVCPEQSQTVAYDNYLKFYDFSVSLSSNVSSVYYVNKQNKIQSLGTVEGKKYTIIDLKKKNCFEL